MRQQRSIAIEEKITQAQGAVRLSDGPLDFPEDGFEALISDFTENQENVDLRVEGNFSFLFIYVSYVFQKTSLVIVHKKLVMLPRCVYLQ